NGDVGLIITGFAYVHPEGKVLPGQTGIHADDHIPDLLSLTTAIHKAGGRVAIQMAHGGIQSRPYLAGLDIPPAGPSAISLPPIKNRPALKLNRELTIAEIKTMVEYFHLAAKRAKDAGFDAIQLHGAHGYLLSQFLSPFFNHRGDRYGGSLANRARFVYEVYEAVRAAVGSDYPVMIKLNCRDFVDGGLELEDSVKAAQNLTEMGLNAVEVSGGLPWSGAFVPSRAPIDTPEKEAYFRLPAMALKEKIKAPVILVGGLRSPRVNEEILINHQADLVSLCRPFIREPDLIKRWAGGDLAPAACTSCGGCFTSGLKGLGISCGELNKNRAAD
ncbi:MAG: NADH:flavin oxidoreductase, partial [Deltaproteobacteria bacterium]|nr:NADH:flavin oxidoreductase [Deltaproteobacteria bacterium]